MQVGYTRVIIGACQCRCVGMYGGVSSCIWESDKVWHSLVSESLLRLQRLTPLQELVHEELFHQAV